MEEKYNENQRGLWIVIVFVITGMLPIIIFLTHDEDLFVQGVLLVTSGIIFLCTFLFYKLKTTVYRNRIKLSFGIGMIFKNIDMSKIKNVEVVRNRWFYGWGVRFILNGWMWNIYGLDAVELTFHDKKSIFRIGSQNPKKLKEKIQEQLLD